jgi:hypothetical protein
LAAAGSIKQAGGLKALMQKKSGGAGHKKGSGKGKMRSGDEGQRRGEARWPAGTVVDKFREMMEERLFRELCTEEGIDEDDLRGEERS